MTSVRRTDWRQNSGIDDTNLELIPPNFFLHNKIVDGENFVSVDELVMQAITRDHSALFDRLALFALHFSHAGARRGTAGIARPAMWANEFVRERLWQDGAWRRSALSKALMDEVFADKIEARPKVRRKVRSNYRHLFELCDYLSSPLDVINSDAASWGVAALFLAWDRLTLDGVVPAASTSAELVSAAADAEMYKLLGLPAAEADDLVAASAQLYIDAGRLDRLAAAPEVAAIIAQEQSDAAVDRRTRTVDQQVRDRQIAADLKTKYGNRCMFCGVALQIGTEPAAFFSNASHIKPLGEPHNGPDRIGNMLVLCPNHHKQFDHGILRLELQAGGYVVRSQLANDPLEGNALEVVAEHDLDVALVEWHFRYFTPVASRQ